MPALCNFEGPKTENDTMRTLIISTLILSTAALADVFVDDPLTSSSMAGRGQRGGSFGADGWTISAEDDTIWYELPVATPEARIEFTVTGLSVGPGGTLSGADHDILTIYQAPSGMAEPVAYSPGFRNNDFKAFIRIFGNQETGRAGAMKLELAACPQGSPWYHDDCPAGCGFAGIAYANGNQNNPGWDPSVSYRIVLEWGNGAMRFWRDGALLGTVTFPGTYAPEPLRIRFGSPRHQGVYPGQAMMPLGIKFKDISITGTPGSPTLVCGAMPPTGGGAGGGTGGGGGTSVPGELGAIADVTAANWESGVFPDVNDLNVEGPGGIAYLRFPATVGAAQNATLTLRTHATSNAAGGSGRICAVSDNNWSETGLTWANKPITGVCVGASVHVNSDTEVQWDVTSLVQAGRATNLAIVSTDPDGAHFISREAGGGATGPRLRVVEMPVQPEVDAGTGPELDAGVPPVVDAGQPEQVDAGTTSPTDGGMIGTPPDNGRNPFEPGDVSGVGGCGCQSGGELTLLLSAVALFVRRRRAQ